MSRVYILVLIALFAACSVTPVPPLPPPTPAPEPAPGECVTFECACSHLCEIACDAMCDPACVDVLGMLADDRTISVDVVCVVRALTADDAERCDGIRCK